MSRIITNIGIMTLFFLYCEVDDVLQKPENFTFFNCTIDNKNYDGDGICFFQKDSTLHIRGFLGTSDFYYQVDVVFCYCEAGTYNLDSSNFYAGISEVYERDAVGTTYKTEIQDSSYIKIVLQNACMSGAIEFQGICENSMKSIILQGVFNINIGEIGYNEWTCDFTNENINNCRFID